jgi:Carboxypeptidase regulatory-like domain
MGLSKPIFLTLTTILCLMVLSNCQPPAGYPSTAEGKRKADSPVQRATGQITGKVSFKGIRPKRIRIWMEQDPVCAREHQSPVYLEDYAVEPDGSLPNAFVYVKRGLERHSYPVPRQPVILTQAGCLFRPHVFGVMVGQPIEITSADPTTHNVHFVPRINRDWNRSLPPGSPPLRLRFTKPEIMIPVTCNQHRWMYAYVGVTTNPFYAVTGSDGKFTMKGLPPGEYTLAVWTATFGTQARQLTVKGNESTAVYFVFN